MTPESHKRTKSYSASLFDGLFTTILSLFFNRCLGYHITSIKRYNLIGKLWSNHNDGVLSRAEDGKYPKERDGSRIKDEEGDHDDVCEGFEEISGWLHMSPSNKRRAIERSR